MEHKSLRQLTKELGVSPSYLSQVQPTALLPQSTLPARNLAVNSHYKKVRQLSRLVT